MAPVPRIPPRLVGLMLIAASGASTLAHRSVYEAVRHGPAQTIEVGLGLLTFVFSSAGILLLLHGGKLFAPVGTLAVSRPRAATDIARLMEPIRAQGRVYDTRDGAALMRARHAIRASRKPDRCGLSDTPLR